MANWRLLLAAAVSAFIAIWSVSHITPPWITQALYATFTATTGLACWWVAGRKRRRNGANSPDSIEREYAAAAAQVTFPISLLAVAAFALFLTATGSPVASLVAFASLGIVALVYWISYSFARTKL